MIDRLEKILSRYNEITNLLTTPEIINDIKKMTKLSKEQSSLEETVSVYKDYKNIVQNIEDDKELLKDNELKEIAKEELQTLEPRKIDLEERLEILLLPKDENDEKDVIMEIRGAAGGDEANIFAGDLFRMYQKYCEKQGWKIDIINAEDGTNGGFSQIEFTVHGKSVYAKLKYESGAHRVQRIPATESQGRIHTSTATVLVLPEEENVEIEVKESDIKVLVVQEDKV